MERFWKSSSIENCLLELLLNSLKAEATAIAVRIDADKQRIQVIDNGFGITRNDLRYVGEKLAKKKILETFESREINSSIPGKNLVKIQELSSCLIIMSRSRFSSDTYGKFFINGKTREIRKIEKRPACGTTITVYTSNNFRGWDEIDSFAIRYIIAYFALINTQVSFSVRDETTSSILLRIGKRQKYRELLRVVCERLLTRDEVHVTKIGILGGIKMEFFWGIECTNSRKIQQILLNLRPVQCLLLNNFIIKIVRKMSDRKANFDVENIFFLFYIECSDSEFTLSMKNDQVIVEFYQIDKILDSVTKVLTKSDLRESKLSELNYKPMPPLMFRPTGRILGVKQKRLFMTKARREILENRRIVMKKKVDEKKIRSEMNGSIILENESSVVINRDTGNAFLKHKSLQNPMKQNKVAQKGQELMQKSKKYPIDFLSRNGHYNILDVSQISQRCIAKTERDSRKSVTTFENGNYSDIFTAKDRREYRVDTENKNREENPPIRNYDYGNHDISWISQKCIEKSQKNSWMSQTCIKKSSTTIEEMFSIGECSQWSNWTYQGETSIETVEKSYKADHPIIWTRFKKLLPLNLHALLPRGNVKLIRRDPLENERFSLNSNFNCRRQNFDVRACAKSTVKIRLKVQSLKSMQVLSQVNQEFIVALTKQDDKKLLVMIDQHAMHERIRYENLLRAYKRDAKNPQFISLTLHRSIIISDFSERNCSLLSINRDLLMQYGLKLTHRNVNTLLIFAVPRCFLKKTFYTDKTKLEIAVRKLLQEIIENLTNGGIKKFLPLTVHDAIASEACHGAIKFGDPLTPSQCDILVSHWKETDTPNRCAHGRPSVIPLLELSSYEMNKYKTGFQEKLKFAALLKSQADSKLTRIAEFIGGRRNCDD